jgi:predicted dinucleotide-binding enzyme
VKIVTIGKGKVGGGLADLWRKAGHQVTELGREGGNATGAEAALLAVPAAAISAALAGIRGLDGVPVIDPTNVVRDPRPEGFDSLAQYVKSLTGGLVAKAFNTNFALLYDKVADSVPPPGMFFAADAQAQSVTERLIRDAGYDPDYVGDLSTARYVEDFIGLNFAIAAQRGPFFYRIGGPGDLR